MIAREREVALLESLVARLDDVGGAVLVSGEAGVGKSALVSWVARERPERRVLRIRGHESEGRLPYAGAAQLLAPLRDHVPRLPPAQRWALTSCLGWSAPRPFSPLAAYAGALALLSSCATPDPLVLIADDAQWLDSETLDALGFVGRRLDRERIALVVAGRPGPRLDSLGFPALELHELTLPECGALARTAGAELSGLQLKRLFDWTGGNPLAVTENLERARDPVEAGEFRLGRRLDRAWGDLLEQYPPATRQALYVVVADGPAGGEHVRAALEGLGLPLDSLEPAEARGLLAVTGDGLTLKNPLLGHVVVDRTPVGVRVAAHRALAAASTGHARAWHLAASACRPDDRVAEQLADAADQARRSGGYDASARAWRRAAELASEPARQAELFLAAATDAHLCGDGAQAVECCAAASRRRRDPVFASDVRRVEGCARAAAGDPHGAVDCLLGGVELVSGVDEARAASLLAEAGSPAASTGRYRLARECGERCGTLVAARPDATGGRSFHPSSLAAHALTMVGRVREAAPLLLAATAAAPAADALLDQLAMARLAQAHLWAGRFDDAQTLAGATVERARRTGASTALGQGLVVRSEVQWWTGRWSAARTDAAQAQEGAERAHQVGLLGESLCQLARLAAGLGDRVLCESLVGRLRLELEPRGAAALGMHAASSLGLLALGEGELSAAIDELDAAWETAEAGGLANPLVVPAWADLSEALARAGQVARASALAGRLADAAEETGLAYPRAAALRVRGVLASRPEEAEQEFVRARALLSDPPIPFELARTLLCEGEALRRAQRVVESRVPLRRALTLFHALGARGWVRRTDGELAATGLRHDPAPHPPSVDLLSPQELQVARSVSHGLNNREVAASLYLSRKTVEAHLTRVYRKLGVHSRTDMTRLLVRQGLDELAATDAEAVSLREGDQHG